MKTKTTASALSHAGVQRCEPAPISAKRPYRSRTPPSGRCQTRSRRTQHASWGPGGVGSGLECARAQHCSLAGGVVLAGGTFKGGRPNKPTSHRIRQLTPAVTKPLQHNSEHPTTGAEQAPKPPTRHLHHPQAPDLQLRRVGDGGPLLRRHRRVAVKQPHKPALLSHLRARARAGGRAAGFRTPRVPAWSGACHSTRDLI